MICTARNRASMCISPATLTLALVLIATSSVGCGGRSSQEPMQQPAQQPAGGTGQITFSFGAEETAFSHNSDSCEPLDVPDTPAHAVRLPDNLSPIRNLMHNRR